MLSNFFLFFLQTIMSELVEQSETDEAQGKIFEQGCVWECGRVHVRFAPDETDLCP